MNVCSVQLKILQGPTVCDCDSSSGQQWETVDPAMLTYRPNSLYLCSLLICLFLCSCSAATACASGYFGQDCQEPCPCKNGASCNPVDGSCACTAGFKDANCSTGKRGIYSSWCCCCQMLV